MRHENDLHRCPSECKNHSGGDSVAMGRVSLLPSALGTLLSGRERERKKKKKTALRKSGRRHACPGLC